MSAETASLGAEARGATGKGPSRAARRAGRVPAVLYGGADEPMSLSLDRRELVLAVEKGGFTSKLLDLQFGSDAQRVLPREVQVHPVTDVPIHVDFLRITADSKINVMVAVIFINEEESPGLKRGGVLNVVRHEVELICGAESIPERLTADLTGLDIGDGIHISSIALPEGVTPAISDRDFTVATVAAPTIHVDEEEEKEGEEGEEGVEGEEGAEGEVGAEGETKEAAAEGGESGGDKKKG